MVVAVDPPAPLRSIIAGDGGALTVAWSTLGPFAASVTPCVGLLVRRPGQGQPAAGQGPNSTTSVSGPSAILEVDRLKLCARATR